MKGLIAQDQPCAWPPGGHGVLFSRFAPGLAYVRYDLVVEWRPNGAKCQSYFSFKRCLSIFRVDLGSGGGAVRGQRKVLRSVQSSNDEVVV